MTDVMDIIYILMSLALSIGVALCLIAKLLEKSNNIGDSYSSFDDHVHTLIKREASHTYNDYTRGMEFIVAYGEDPFEKEV